MLFAMFGVQYLAVFVLFCFCIFRVENVGIIDQTETCRVYCKIEDRGNIPCKVKFLGKHCNLTSEDYGVRRKHIPKRLYSPGYNCSDINDKVVYNIEWRQRGYKRYPLIDGYLINMEYVTVTKRKNEYYLIESNVTNVSKHYTFTLSWECNKSIVFVRTKMILLPNKKRLIKKVMKDKTFPEKLETDKIEIYVPKRCKKKELCHCLTSFKLHSNSSTIGVMYKPADPSIESRVEVNSFDGQIFLKRRCSINKGNCSLIFSELNPANYTVSVFYRNNESEDGCKCYVLRQQVEVTGPSSGEFHMSESKQKPVSEVIDLDTVLIISAGIGCFITVSIMIIISIKLKRKKMLGCGKSTKRMSNDFDTFDIEPLLHSGPARVMLVSCYEETNNYFADAVKRFADLLGDCSVQVTHFYDTASHGQLMANVNDYIEQSVSSNSVFLFVLTNQMFEKLIHRKRKYAVVSRESLDVDSSFDVVSYTIDLIRRKRHKRCHWIQFFQDEDHKRHLFVTESLRKLYPMFQDSKQWCMINKQNGGFDEKVWNDFIGNICNSTSGSGFISQERMDNFVASVQKYIN